MIIMQIVVVTKYIPLHFLGIIGKVVSVDTDFVATIDFESDAI